MTAANVSKAMDIDKIRVNYIYSELLSRTFFLKNPLPHLEINSKEKEVIKKKFLKGIEFEDKKTNFEIGEQIYPEDYDNIDKRCQKLTS